MRVFISHSSKDKPAVERLALALREHGIEPWLDKWEIGPGDDIVARINEGLDAAEAGIIVFSRHSRESRWVEAEVSYLIYARIEESKVLIPVVAGEDPWVPPLLRPLARRGIEDVEAIAGGLLSRSAGPPPARPAEVGRVERVLIALEREGEGGVRTSVRIGSQEHGGASFAGLPPALVAAQAEFLRGPRAGLRRSPAEAARAALDQNLAALGRELRALCLPGGAGEALANLVDGCPLGTLVEVCFEAGDPMLLGLPFEALRLPDDRLLATQPPVVVYRRPAGLAAGDGQPLLAGPLKILVAVGAPDEGQTASVVLDQERELQSILDAVEPAQRHENVEVRILEVGHPEVIGDALAADAYHVLHLSCHGSPGALELEDEEGRAVNATAKELLTPLRGTGRPLPLVLVNACHGGVQEGQTASLGEALLRTGVAGVLAMQTSVSDAYATRLARAFYEHLAQHEPPLASRALAAARKELEKERLAALQRPEPPLAEVQPEYATASLYLAGEERPLADFGLDKKALRVRPVYETPGPVPQLRIDDLIGRRKELRETLRTLRDEGRQFVGVVLTGIGGVGKSAVAGRAMQRLAEDGRLVPAHAGRFDLGRIALALGVALQTSERHSGRQLGAMLAQGNLDDSIRLQLVAKALAEEPVVLVLDDFEQNLAVGGGAFLDPDVPVYLDDLAKAARRGRLLVTSRYPVPGIEAYLRHIPIGPLSSAESRKLLLRLPKLREEEPAALARVLRVIGGHPRMLEFLDALLRGGQGRLSHVTEKLQRLIAAQGLAHDTTVADLEAGVARALLLGARDVFLDELLDLARREGIDEVLLQTATSNLPVSPAGLARMLAGDGGDPPAVEGALARLADLSLVHRFPGGDAWVHRWTAEGLGRLVDPGVHRARHVRAGRYRMWRVEHETRDLDDGWEAVRNFLAGQDFDAAATAAFACFAALRRFRQSVMTAALGSEVLETLPRTHAAFAAVADEEAEAHLALGLTDRAMARYEELREVYEHRAQLEPDSAEHQHVLSALYQRFGDTYRTLGKGQEAREAYLNLLTIRERLAAAEPDRADYQRDLSVSYNKVADLYRALGQGEQARQAYLNALAIAERLAAAEPDRADYQHDLMASYQRLGDLQTSAGRSEEARKSYLKLVAIAEQLAAAEPDRADYQRDLSVSYTRLADVFASLGQPEEAQAYNDRDLAIAERLAAAEPERADYRRDLVISLMRAGAGAGPSGREHLERALATAEAMQARGQLAQPDEALISGLRELLGGA